MTLSKPKRIASWIGQLIAVAIMGQTLFFKFTGHAESVQLFTELEMEPTGRYLIGALELVACLLLLIPSSVVYGALLGAGLMSGAIIGHITRLGWAGDRLSLGLSAIAALTACSAVLFLRRKEIPLVKSVLKDRPH